MKSYGRSTPSTTLWIVWRLILAVSHRMYWRQPGIRCRPDVPVCLPPLAVTAEVRHNVFLAFKEILHNVLKHANASEVEISLEPAPNGFTLVIADNGRGFALDSPSQAGNGHAEKQRLGGGNGLLNVRKRMEDLGGSCEWETAPGLGTIVRLVIENVAATV